MYAPMFLLSSLLSFLFILLPSGSRFNGGVVVVHAFSAPAPGRTAMRRPDASAAVEEALKVTAAFGLESNEAKVAWEIVEELDARYVLKPYDASIRSTCIHTTTI
jgi:CP12 domain